MLILRINVDYQIEVNTKKLIIHQSWKSIYIYIYIVIVMVIFIWWSPFIPSTNLYRNYAHIWL